VINWFNYVFLGTGLKTGWPTIGPDHRVTRTKTSIFHLGLVPEGPDSGEISIVTWIRPLGEGLDRISQNLELDLWVEFSGETLSTLAHLYPKFQPPAPIISRGSGRAYFSCQNPGKSSRRSGPSRIWKLDLWIALEKLEPPKFSDPIAALVSALRSDLWKRGSRPSNLEPDPLATFAERGDTASDIRALEVRSGF